MNKEKELQQTAVSAGGYLAPSVKVHEIKTRKVLCASGQEFGNDGNEQYYYQNGNGWW